MNYSKEDMLGMYRSMIQARLFDQELERQNKLGHLVGMFHLSFNQEAIGAAIAAAIHDDEPFMPSHRSRPLHLHRIDYVSFISEQVGLGTGVHGGTSSDFHICKPDVGFLPNPSILGSGAPIATGYAFGLKRLRPGKAIIQLMGDGTFNQGVVHESMHWACLQKLPIVYVVENNSYQVGMSSKEFRSGENIADRCRSVGMDAVVVDGNDVLAVREAVEIALERARTRCLPSAIECRTYRSKGHWDGDTCAYRDPVWHEEMMKRYPDPIPRFAQVLIENGLATQEELDAMSKALKKEIRKSAEKVYELSQDPKNLADVDDLLKPETMYADVMEGLQ